MKEDIEEIIRKLEKAMDMLYKKKPNEANTIICEAQALAIFLRDHAG